VSVLSQPVGGAPTLTVTLLEFGPPGPLQFKVKVLVGLISGPVDSPGDILFVAFEPVQVEEAGLAEAVQEVASVVFQVRVVLEL